MASHVMVVIDDLDDIGHIERSLVSMAVRSDIGFYVVSMGGTETLMADEAAPCRLRLMLLLARLADRLIPASGEVLEGSRIEMLRQAIQRQAPQQVLVASHDRPVDRLLRRDVVGQLRKLLDIDVVRLPVHA